VAKTLHLSQINFHASIIKLDERTIEETQTIINNFILGKIRAGRGLVCMPPESGGLGFINLREFICSLQCSWIKRAFRSSIDTWRFTLNCITGTDVTAISPDMVDKDTNPKTHGIVESFVKFKAEFFLRNDNFLDSSIIGNPLLIDNIQRPVPVFNTVWTDENGFIRLNFLKDKKISDLLNIDSGIKAIGDMSETLQMNLSQRQYALIENTLKVSMKFVKKNRVETIAAEDPDIKKFLTRFKKGSKPFRKILSYRALKKIKCD
jgi:hypothetical protein